MIKYSIVYWCRLLACHNNGDNDEVETNDGSQARSNLIVIWIRMKITVTVKGCL